MIGRPQPHGSALPETVVRATPPVRSRFFDLWQMGAPAVRRRVAPRGNCRSSPDEVAYGGIAPPARRKAHRQEDPMVIEGRKSVNIVVSLAFSLAASA